MTDPRATPTCAVQGMATVLEHVQLARGTFRIRLAEPSIAAAIAPGQFVMIRPAHSGPDPLLGRPFALYDVLRDSSAHAHAIDIVYLVMGRGTSLLTTRKVGESLAIWGPLGHHFGPPPQDEGPIVFVAGGIGQTPFLSLARWWSGEAEYGAQSFPKPPTSREILLYYGARNEAFLAGVGDFRGAGVRVRLATDDGSAGHHGFVTDLLRKDLDEGLRPAKILGCGPHPMLAALQSLVVPRGIACELSLENHMACGFGACFSCVAPIRQADGTTDLRRVCVDGPIFPAKSVVFQP